MEDSYDFLGGYTTQLGQQLRDEQTQAQKKVFTKWVNKNLSHLKKNIVKDLFEDLKDGRVLLDLLEVLAGEKLPRSRLPGIQNNEIVWTNNIAEAFKCLKKHGVPLVNIHTSNIVDGEPKIILGLVWQFILHFQILQVLPQWDEADAKSGQGDERKQLLNWVTSKLHRAGDPLVNDFGSSWRDGRAFLTLVHNLVVERRPRSEERDVIVRDIHRALTLSGIRPKLELAFDLAEGKLGVARLLEVEDVDVERPDQRSVMMYVAQFVPDGRGEAVRQTAELQQESLEQQQHHMPILVQKPDTLPDYKEPTQYIPWECLAIAIVVVFLAFLLMFATVPAAQEQSD